jgi:hypothetical protein
VSETDAIKQAEMKAFIAAWKIAGPELERLRDEELHSVSLMEAMAQLSDMVDSAVFLKPLVPYSGLIEMQAVFRKLRG